MSAMSTTFIHLPTHPLGAVASCIEEIRRRSPLVHNITNMVVINFTANVLLAAGASPVMAHAREEVEEMCGHASSLVLNIGTLDAGMVDAMLLAGAIARKRGIPIVFDPVGVGATQYRTAVARQIMESVRPTILRGNASEIAALEGTISDGAPKGVDATLNSSSLEVLSSARRLSDRYGCVVVISGEVDHVVSGDKHHEVHNGTSLFTRVTGMGCAATAYLGATAAVCTDPLFASVVGMAAFAVAGEVAVEECEEARPGRFSMSFLDSLAQLTSSTLLLRAHIC